MAKRSQLPLKKIINATLEFFSFFRWQPLETFRGRLSYGCVRVRSGGGQSLNTIGGQ